MVVALLAEPKLPLAGPLIWAHCQLTSVVLLSAVRVILLRPHEVSTCGVFDPGILEVAHYPLG